MASGVDSREKKTADMAYTTEKFFADIDAKNYTMSSVGLITSLSSASNARTITIVMAARHSMIKLCQSLRAMRKSVSWA
jgi:hypothetical protein